MRDVLAELDAWWRAGERAALATVVATWNSSPRQVGAAMAVGPGTAVVGSVSGGCVEAEVYETAQAVRAEGVAVLRRYGVSDSDAYAAGLTCGGVIDILIEPVDRDVYPELGGVIADIRDGRPVAVATLIDPPHDARRRMVVRPASAEGGFASMRLNDSMSLDDAVRDDARDLLSQGHCGIVRYGSDGQRRDRPEEQRHGDECAVFVASFAPRPRMIVFGAIDFAAALARAGSFLGYRVTVCDARATFATAARFPDADEVVVQWPHHYLRDAVDAGAIDETTVICVLTHDPKFDVPLLELALRLPVGYVGAMGSRRTNDERLQQLRARGLSEQELARLHAPIGLDIGSRTPQETAVSIAAEIVAARWGASGTPLRDTEGPIHRDRHSP